MGRKTNLNDSVYYNEWMKKADEDILVAKILLSNPDCKNSCAFHCQQSIEKSLKAYVLLVDKKLLDGHNLTWLCRQALTYDESFRQWLDESYSLNRYYIETRYPADIPTELSAEKINDIYKMAKDMFDFIDMHIESIENTQNTQK
jgi:HEPN domain-containing protein